MNTTNLISIYQNTLEKITNNTTSYFDFLSLAGRLPKYSFQNQILIYAQKPLARACYTMETWNHKFKCLVPEGTSPIFILDEDELPLMVVDISDVSFLSDVSKNPPKLTIDVHNHEKYFTALMLEYMNAYNIPDNSKGFEVDIQSFAYYLTEEKIADIALSSEQAKDFSAIVQIAIAKVVLEAFNVTSTYDVPIEWFELSRFNCTTSTIEALSELINETSLEIINVLEHTMLKHSLKSAGKEFEIVE